MKKILIFRPGALGDTILSFPLLEILKKKGFQTFFVGNSEYISLIDFFQLGKGISFDHSIFLPIFEETNSKLNLLKNFINQFDFIFAIEKEPLIYEKIKKIHNSTYFIKSIPDYQIPIRLYLIIEILKILNIDFIYKINYIKNNTNYNKFIIHPGAGSKHKIWNIENFDKIIKFLLNKSKKITILEGPAEKGISKVFEKYKNNTSLLQTNDIYQIINCLRQNDFFIGNDSGITHLASYLGISGIAIFGTTNPWLWNPLPNISCFYDINSNYEIQFPNTEIIISYLKNYL